MNTVDAASPVTPFNQTHSALTRVLDAGQSRDALLDTKKAAQHLDVEPQTLEVWRCTKRYEIPYIKVGRLIKYRLSDLDAWLNSRTVGSVGGSSHE